MVRVNVGAMNNVCNETVVPTMPFLFRSVEHMHKVLDGPVGQEILKACEKQGFIGLGFYDSGARSMFTAKRPVKSLADMKGMKVRVQQSDLWVSMLEAMGANATPMPMGEVYTGLKTGLIDAAENNYPTFESSRSFEVAKYFSKTEHSMAPEILLFSKRTFDKLARGAGLAAPGRQGIGALYAQAVGRARGQVAGGGEGGGRRDHRSGQGAVPGGNAAGV